MSDELVRETISDEDDDDDIYYYIADACTLVFYAHDHYDRHQARSQHCREMSCANNRCVMPTLVRPVMGSYE